MEGEQNLAAVMKALVDKRFHAKLASAFKDVWTGVYECEDTVVSDMGHSAENAAEVVKEFHAEGDPTRRVRALVAFDDDDDSMSDLLDGLLEAREQEPSWQLCAAADWGMPAIVVIACPDPDALADALAKSHAGWAGQLSETKREAYKKLAEDGLQPWDEDERLVFEVSEE